MSSSVASQAVPFLPPSYLTSDGRRNHGLLIVDRLLKELPDQADRLLDLRLFLSRREVRKELPGGQPREERATQAGTCVKLYFQLRAALPAWRRSLCDELGTFLEEAIQIQVAIADSLERAKRCCCLKSADSLESCCLNAMREVAHQYPDQEGLHLSFAWAA